MDESFSNRVDKIFGSLGKSSSSLHSLWSLTDEEVEKREWNRERGEIDREENPCSSSFDGFFARERRKSERKPRNFRKELEDDLEDLTDGDDEKNEPAFNRSEDERDEWDIRSSIGLDCTLDNEEEEDEYDKVAVGRDGADDRMYMRNVTDYGTHLNSYNVIPDSFKDHTRDPRANHLAARIRLKEDGKEARSFVSVSTSDDKMTGVESPQVTEDGSSLKSILKRKVEHDDTKAQKRVRFDSRCKDVCEDKVEEEAQDSPMATCPIEPAIVAENPSSVSQDAGVPDYIRNPSKYTRYSFDSTTDINESSNRQACMDFLNMIRRSKAVDIGPETTAADMPGSVTFIPRKKAGDTFAATKKCDKVNQNQEDASKESMHRTSLQLGIAAREADENDVCAMEEDELQVETESKSMKSQKPGRQYRAKVT